MERYQEVLKSLDIILEDLTESQLNSIKQIADRIGDPSKITINEAMAVVKELHLDIEKLQRHSRRIRAEMKKSNSKPKIGRNEKCPCNSGEKWKHCCGNKI